MSLLCRRTTTNKKLSHGEISPQYISPIPNKVNLDQCKQKTINDTVTMTPITKTKRNNPFSTSKIAFLFFTTMFLMLSSVSAERKQTDETLVSTCEQIIIQLVNLTSIIKEYSSLQNSIIIRNESKLYYIYEKPKFHEQITTRIIDLIFVTFIILIEIMYLNLQSWPLLAKQNFTHEFKNYAINDPESNWRQPNEMLNFLKKFETNSKTNWRQPNEFNDNFKRYWRQPNQSNEHFEKSWRQPSETSDEDSNLNISWRQPNDNYKKFETNSETNWRKPNENNKNLNKPFTKTNSNENLIPTHRKKVKKKSKEKDTNEIKTSIGIDQIFKQQFDKLNDKIQNENTKDVIQTRYIRNLVVDTEPTDLGTKDNQIILLPKISKKTQYIILDSGAQISAISDKTYNEWNKNKFITKELLDTQNLNIVDARSSKLNQTHNPVIVTLNFDGKFVEHKFYVIENLSNTLIGLDFIREHELTLNVKQESIDIVFSKDGKHFRGYYPSNLLLIPKYTSCIHPGLNEIHFETPHPDNTILHLQTKLEKDHPIIFQEGIAKVENHEITLVFLNKSDIEYPFFDLEQMVTATLLEDNVVISKLGTTQTTNKGLETEFDLEKDYDDLIKAELEEDEALEPKGIEIDLNQNHPPIDIEYHVKRLFPPQFHEFMIEFFKTECPDLIARHSYDSGTLDENILVVKDLNIKPGSIVRCKPLKLDFIRQTQLDRALEIMEKAGILVKGVSSMYSPAFIISKHDGRCRVVISYVNLNKCIENVNYTIPDTKQVLMEIGKECPEYLSTIDLSAAYSAVSVQGEASKQAAICTQTDTYLLRKLLFGISSSPGMFNYAIAKIIDTIDQSKRKFIAHFFDDLTIYSSKWKDSNKTTEEIHLDCILKTLRAIKNSGMKIRLEKCSFFQRQISVLGRVISKQGISPNAKSVQAVQDIQPPQNLKQLQSTIGLLIWASHFILNFSFHMHPIFNLLDKNAKIKWTEEQEKALQHFKTVYTEKCILYWPDYNRKIYVACDASAYSIGSVLYQTRTLPRDFKLLQDEFIGNEPLSEQDKADIATIPTPGKKCPNFFKFNRFDDQLTPYTELNVKLSVDQDMTNDGNIHVCLPIAFHSMSLGKARSKWVILEKEAFSIFHTIQKYGENLLKGFKEVFILSDSSPLLFTMKGATATGTQKLQRWICALSQYPFTIYCCSISSKQNLVSDLLSRHIYWYLEDSEHVERKFVGRKVLVKSPFKFNELITIKDIAEALKKDPNCVYQYEPETVDIQRIFVNFAGTNVVEDLTELFHDSNILKSQQKDNYCNLIKEDLVKNRNFYVLNGILYRKARNQTSIYERGRVVLTESLVTPCIIRFHYDNHAGIVNILNHMNESYYYPNLFNKISSLLAACHLCNCYLARSPKPLIKEHPFWPVEKGYVWHADVTSGYTIVNNHRAILVMQEYYSKYKLFAALKHETAEEIANILENQLFKIFGPPRVLSTDNAMNLIKSYRVQRLLKKYNVRPHLMSPNHPSSHGSIEIVNKQLHGLLRILNDRFPESWPNLLGLAQVMLNNKKSITLGWRSPQYIMFGCESNIDDPLRTKESNYLGFDQVEDLFKEMKIELDKIIKKWQYHRNKENQKRGGKVRKYPVGSWVYMRDFGPGTKRKLRTKYYKPPLYVLAEFDSTVLVKSWQGIVYSSHKANIRPFRNFDKKDYDSLPPHVKSQLGVAFTYKDLKKLMDENEIPELFTRKGWSQQRPEPINLPRNEPNQENVEVESVNQTLEQNQQENQISNSSQESEQSQSQTLSQNQNKDQERFLVDVGLEEPFEEPSTELQEPFNEPIDLEFQETQTLADPLHETNRSNIGSKLEFEETPTSQTNSPRTYELFATPEHNISETRTNLEPILEEPEIEPLDPDSLDLIPPTQIPSTSRKTPEISTNLNTSVNPDTVPEQSLESRSSSYSLRQNPKRKKILDL